MCMHTPLRQSYKCLHSYPWGRPPRAAPVTPGASARATYATQKTRDLGQGQTSCGVSAANRNAFQAPLLQRLRYDLRARHEQICRTPRHAVVA